MKLKEAMNASRRWGIKAPWVSWTLAGMSLLFAVYLAILYVRITQRFEGQRWQLPSKVYSDSFLLYPRQDITSSRLPARLNRLGYYAVSGMPLRPGEYRVEPDSLEIFLHDFSYPDRAFQGFLLRLVLENDRIVRMVDLPTGEELKLAEIEPELIAAFYNQTWEERDLVPLKEVSPHLIQAVLAIEDNRFYRHAGVDLKSMARAMWVNLKEGAIVQGGSTLTQQLVKNYFLDPERTVTRKINEILMALMLEMRYSKQEILETYFNEIYWGQSGTMGVFGVGEAARFYFGKRPSELSLGESALLAGMIKSPNLYSPFIDPERAVARRKIVLDRMRRLDLIRLADYVEAVKEEIPKRVPVERRRTAPYFVDFVRQQLGEQYPAEVLTTEGLRIFTTLDMEQQQSAEAVLVRGLERLERNDPALYREDPSERLQGCLIVLQPQTGYIQAMVGGRDYSVSQFNRATQARRQPGSLFKPFVYAAALLEEGSYTAASVIEDSPITLISQGEIWNPQNYDKTFYGPVTLRTALENSLNVATIKLAQAIGIERVIRTAVAMGLKSPMQPIPSLALGTAEVVPLEIAGAYGTIANGGLRIPPMAVKEVMDGKGQVVERKTLEMDPVLTPQQAYILTYLLQGVVDHGTARGIRALGYTGPVAGKTGTTSHDQDAWFAGFTPDRLTLVWVGFDQANPAPLHDGMESDSAETDEVHLTGARAALPIWTDFMMKAGTDRAASDFAVPPGIVFEAIDPQTGLLADGRCPGGVREAFIDGTQPQESCGGSGGSLPGRIMKWLKRLIALE
jgi:penicillin-binding protein 1B